MKTQEEWEALPYEERKRLLSISYTFYHERKFFGGTANSLEVLNLIKKHRYNTHLDYGTGTGGLFVYTNRRILDMSGRKVKTRPYDPYSTSEEYRMKPAEDERFDLVSCTDVLEHILPEDIDDVLWTLVNHTKKMLYCTIATYPASKMICDEKGKDIYNQSLHTLVRPKKWWLDKFEALEQKLYDEQNRWISMDLRFD